MRERDHLALATTTAISFGWDSRRAEGQEGGMRQALLHAMAKRGLTAVFL
jgi:hypothetical protein